MCLGGFTVNELRNVSKLRLLLVTPTPLFFVSLCIRTCGSFGPCVVQPIVARRMSEWIQLESDPAVLTELVEKIGVEGVEVERTFPPSPFPPSLNRCL